MDRSEDNPYAPNATNLEVCNLLKNKVGNALTVFHQDVYEATQHDDDEAAKRLTGDLEKLKEAATTLVSAIQWVYR